MNVLSIKQPWAWAVVNGLKPVENRTWKTHVRGEIGIHAGKTFDYDGYAWMRINHIQLGIALSPHIARATGWPLIPFANEFPSGGIVGFAELVDCVQQYDSPWFSGPYGFVFYRGSIKPCELIPMKGKQGWMKVSDDLLCSARLLRKAGIKMVGE